MNIHPFPYAIPDEYIVTDVPAKTRIFSEIIPGNATIYRFKAGCEAAYVQQYRESRFAQTRCKGGWDCLRHYEILAAGCIPVLEAAALCPANTMVSFPIPLLKEALQALLPWDDSKIPLYNTYVLQLLEHCRAHCSVSAMVTRFLTGLSFVPKRILLLSCHEGENYTRELLSIGLRRRFDSDFVEAPKLEVLYEGCDLSLKYGNGFTYGGHLIDKNTIDRTRLEERIQAKEFDLIIYGKMGKDEGPLGSTATAPYWNAVRANYPRERIAFLYGGDGRQVLRDLANPYTTHLLQHATAGVCFVRELD